MYYRRLIRPLATWQLPIGEVQVLPMELSGAAHRRRLQALRMAVLALVAIAFGSSVYIINTSGRLSRSAAPGSSIATGVARCQSI